MLTVDVLKSIEGMNDELAATIAEMSKNDEDEVIRSRSRTMWDTLDNSVLTASGVKKASPDEKTSEYAARVIGLMKGKAEKFDEQTENLSRMKSELTNLKKQLDEGGGDAGLAEKLEKERQDRLKTQKEYGALKDEYDQYKTNVETRIKTESIRGELNSALSSIKFKPDIADGIKNLAVDSITKKLLAMQPEITETEGIRQLIFRKEDGTMLMNPENKLNPYTPAELFAKEFKALDILDTGKETTGGGTSASGGTGGNGTIDLAGCKTKADAFRAIDKHILSTGVLRGTPAFESKRDELLTENPEVRQLPDKIE